MPPVRESITRPYWASPDGRCAIYHGDSLELLPKLVKGNASLICTDPPYFGVKKNDWDNQWETDADFLAWVSRVCELLEGAISPNGSLYWFASPQMAARIECEIAKRFNVLNHIVWSKGDSRGGVVGTGIDVTALRKFWTSSSERIVFAERYGSDKSFGDALIDGNRTYETACEETKRGIFGDYLRDEFKRAGVTQKQIAALFPSASGGLTGCVSNWLIGYNCPTKKQYEEIRQFLNAAQHNGNGYLRQKYEGLRQKYEGLRQKYEGLRRPFQVSAQDEWGDVWRFPIERNQIHPTQKPFRLMSHIVRVSSQEGDLVVDPFMGSGTTGVSCAHLGRRFIGIEQSEKYCELAETRIKVAYRQAEGKSKNSKGI